MGNISNMSNFFQFDNNMAIILAETCQEITEYKKIKKKKAIKMTWQITCFRLKSIADFHGENAVLQNIALKKTLKEKNYQFDFPTFVIFIPSK